MTTTTAALTALIGQPVYVHWRPSRGDWPWFTLLGFDDGNGTGEVLLYLRGRNAPDGSRHRGDSFAAPLGDVVGGVEGVEAGDGPAGE